MRVDEDFNVDGSGCGCYGEIFAEGVAAFDCAGVIGDVSGICWQ